MVTDFWISIVGTSVVGIATAYLIRLVAGRHDGHFDVRVVEAHNFNLCCN